MDLEQIQQQYPFLTCLNHSDCEYVCIVQNCDEKVYTFYDYGVIPHAHERKLFLKFGDIWWNESNRTVPINIFLRGYMDVFSYALKTANVKDVEVVFGPVTSLNNLINKRIKRRQIQLVKRVD